jgi:hypothetical protein
MAYILQDYVMFSVFLVLSPRALMFLRFCLFETAGTELAEHSSGASDQRPYGRYIYNMYNIYINSHIAVKQRMISLEAGLCVFSVLIPFKRTTSAFFIKKCI